MSKKKIVFITGTRADFGKLKSLMNKIEKSSKFECYVFVTGMHTLPKYDYTFHEVENEGYKNIFIHMNQSDMTHPEIILCNTIIGFSNFIRAIKPDMIVVLGDRVEMLAGAITGSFNNILVAHIEGGEISGTIDELIRHAITKLSHLHFVANEEAKMRLMHMGEDKKNIFVIGSPDIDIMKSSSLPSLEEVKRRYGIKFDEYGMFIYHPVTTELERLGRDIKETVSAIIESNKKYVVIYPNSDEGSDIIISELKRLEGKSNFRIFPSIRFEYFLTLLKNAKFMIGNSSAGVRETEIYGIPAINIGSRQKNRTRSKNIINVEPIKKHMINAIFETENKKIVPVSYFGDGNSTEKFYEIINKEALWKTDVQKHFLDFVSSRNHK